MYILKKLNREKKVFTEAEHKALLAEGWEDVTPSRDDRTADAFSIPEKSDTEPPAGDGEGKPDEEPPAGDGGEKTDEKSRNRRK